MSAEVVGDAVGILAVLAVVGTRSVVHAFGNVDAVVEDGGGGATGGFDDEEGVVEVVVVGGVDGEGEGVATDADVLVVAVGDAEFVEAVVELDAVVLG